MDNIRQRINNLELANSQAPMIQAPQVPQVTLDEMMQSLQPVQPVPNSMDVQEEETSRTESTNSSADDLLKQIRSNPSKETVQKKEQKREKGKGNTVGDWLGETVKNTLVNRPIELASGAREMLFHPIQNIGRPLGEYFADKYWESQEEGLLKPTLETVRDVSNLFVYQPLTGQKIEDIISQKPSETGKKYLDYIHEGGLTDTYLTLLPTKAGQVINKGIGKGVSKVANVVDDKVFQGKGKELLKTKEARKEIREQTVTDKIEAIKKSQEFKGRINDALKSSKADFDDLTNVVKKAEGFEGQTLENLTGKEVELWEKLKPVLDDWDTYIQQYETATPGNITEIVTHGIRKSQDGGINTTYQAVDDAYRNAGFYDLGNFVEKGTNKIIKQNDTLRALSENTPELRGKNIGVDIVEGKPVEFDLRNTDFIIPEENLEILAEKAMKGDSLAGQFLESYELARDGKLHRVSHGLAQVDKDALAELPKKAKIVESEQLATERAYGNAPSEEIARQWYDPDNILQYAMKKIIREKVIDDWFNTFKNQGEGVMSKNATPDDIRFVNRGMLNDSIGLKNIDKYALKEIPEGVDASQYIPVDKYSLKAYKDLFFNAESNAKIKLPAFLKDLTTLYKQWLLTSGLYLGGNFFGGMHSFLTQSGTGFFNDISDAIKTRGSLIKELGLERETPKVGDFRLRTKAGTKIGDIVRGAYKFNDSTGAYVARWADATLQNKLAELNAHAILRQKGIPLENRNLQWIKENMSKQEIYELLDDIQKSSLIYGEDTLIPREGMNWLEVGNPFIRWVDQATQSSGWLMKKHPTMFGYLQGVVLGRIAWDENEARALGLGIDNPQSGKMYKIDTRTGNSKTTEVSTRTNPKSIIVSEAETIPVQTTLKAVSNPGEYLMKTDRNATVGALLGITKPTNDYGVLKQRKNWGDLVPDYQRNVRYDKNGMIKEQVEPDEMLAGLFKTSGAGRAINQTIMPTVGNLLGKPVYTPYSEQWVAGPWGNPNKPYNLDKVGQRLAVEYEHPAYAGSDIPITEKRMKQLEKSQNKRQAKMTRKQKADMEKMKLKGGNE